MHGVTIKIGNRSFCKLKFMLLHSTEMEVRVDLFMLYAIHALLQSSYRQGKRILYRTY